MPRLNQLLQEMFYIPYRKKHIQHFLMDKILSPFHKIEKLPQKLMLSGTSIRTYNLVVCSVYSKQMKNEELQ